MKYFWFWLLLSCVGCATVPTGVDARLQDGMRRLDPPVVRSVPR